MQASILKPLLPAARAYAAASRTSSRRDLAPAIEKLYSDKQKKVELASSYSRQLNVMPKRIDVARKSKKE
jgi:hypothetical protein